MKNKNRKPEIISCFIGWSSGVFFLYLLVFDNPIPLQLKAIIVGMIVGLAVTVDKFYKSEQ